MNATKHQAESLPLKKPLQYLLYCRNNGVFVLLCLVLLLVVGTLSVTIATMHPQDTRPGWRILDAFEFSNVTAVNGTLPLCPVQPPNLVGPIEVKTLPPSWKELEKRYQNLEPGGRWRPSDCTSRHRVAIIVPYRDRESHLRVFLNNLHAMLQKQQLDYCIYVIEQAR
ncbi:PREDICTED: beta-1,4-N-acetylgalactosaminyltransferase bre-4-like [Priapulus caudatus]|uniref:Beta-1,4-N-acetylgalactosaminyltransferase bre-4-like n=1 Tax=Priapulus caudatus TaxID=37621 RepID=A0ABM1EZ63_PRICU|nr:PREDICTED: beta-1,4-N-acetylgalactosaminyltransferase bre-4-like [Priapulus caudatus]